LVNIAVYSHRVRSLPYICTNGSINNIPGRFLIDTGYGGLLVINNSLKLDYHPPEWEIKDATGRSIDCKGASIEVVIGDLHIKTEAEAIKMMRSFIGILGLQFLKRCGFHFSPGLKQLSLYYKD